MDKVTSDIVRDVRTCSSFTNNNTRLRAFSFITRCINRITAVQFSTCVLINKAQYRQSAYVNNISGKMAPRKKWTRADLEAAFSAVENGTNANLAAKMYKIPRRTLREYIDKNKNRKKKPYSQTYTDENDNVLKEETTKQVDCLDTDTSWFNVPTSWYCHGCEVNTMSDMRRCFKCLKWYHEICVGLTADDLDPFECPYGC